MPQHSHWHYILGYLIITTAHNWPVILALALAGYTGWRLYQTPTRRNVQRLYGWALLAFTYEYIKHLSDYLAEPGRFLLTADWAWMQPLSLALIQSAWIIPLVVGVALLLAAYTGAPMRRISFLLGVILTIGLLVSIVMPVLLRSSAAGRVAPAAKASNMALVPLILSCEPNKCAAGPTATSNPNATASPRPTRTTTPTATPTSEPGNPTAQNYNILVGPGYTDVSPKQLVRTSGNRLYIGVSNCEVYPCTDAAQKLRMYRANSIGVPTGFTLLDINHMPAGVSQWAIAIDSSDTIHVVWNDRANTGGDLINLRYTTFSTSSDTWSGSVETIDTPLDVGTDGGGQGVQSVALALDASGAPHVVYLKGNAGNRRMYHRSRSSGGWSAATQIDDGVTYGNNQKAWHPNLAFDTTGRLLAVWERGSFNSTTDGTIFSRVRATNGTWGATINVSGDNAARVVIDQSTSLLVTPDNRYHMTWLAATTDYIHYQYSDDNGQSWATNNPGGGAQATHNPSLGYAAGKLRIYGHGTQPQIDGHGDHLYYFEGSGGSAAWGGWTQFVTGAHYDSSVNVRWSQFFFAFPNTIDLAYWNDNYPNVLYAGTDIK
ncbi:MAG: sialidase family protein [Roseiflexaceae bacterium]